MANSSSLSSVPPAIEELIAQLDTLAPSRNDAWQIPRLEGEMLHQLALALRARTIVEVGTSYGFSGLFWGAALLRTGGHLHTIDRDPRKVQLSREIFIKAGLAQTITNHHGDAADVLATLAGPFDLVFIDADKDRCPLYFDLVWPQVRVGGCVLTDNATTHRKELAAYVASLRGRADAASCEVAIGNGVEWTTRLAE